jgi:cation diffusion facilitator CzcD-associated flavoprotein CzcO
MPEQDFDVLVIGAGFGGLRMLHEARERGFSVRLLEAESDVGGTWRVNRYPGARTDCESSVYCFSFDQALWDEWDWSERYPTQPQVESYLRHVADRFDMRRDIQFDTRVESAVFDEEQDLWTVTTSSGEQLVSRFLVGAAGPLSAVKEPDFPGLSSFQGEWHVTGRWPEQPVDFANKRVAVIGTGASGMQLIPIVAKVASQLTVFQRTANYGLPARNYALDDIERQAMKNNYEQIWQQAAAQPMGMPMNLANRTIGDVTPEEANSILEAGWEEGGFRFFLESFDDVFVDPASNQVVSDFIRNKIRTIVKDPATAELLCPKRDHPFGAKRPPLTHFYYETYNRDNVSLVDISSNAIAEIVPNGVKLEDGSVHQADIIVFAIGFDALTGALTRIDIRGRGGRTLSDKWSSGPRTHLSIAVDEFPNFFMVSGPQIPFANATGIIEPGVESIGAAMTRTVEQGHTRIEAKQEACEEYNALLESFWGATIFPAGEKLRAWWVGTNVEGKPAGVAMHFGGFPNFVASVRAEAEAGFENFRFSSTPETQRSLVDA